MRAVAHEEMPADAGLSALGLMMRLGGSVAFWFGAYILVLVLMLKMGLGVVAVVALGMARSFLHMRAGRALAAARIGGHRLAWAYVGVGALHTAALVPSLDSLPAPVAGATSVIIGLSLSWPAVVAGLLLRPSARAVVEAARSRGRRIFAEDLNTTGVAALMAVLGGVGTVMVALWMLMIVQVGTLKAGFLGWLSLMIAAGFLLRSFLHARAGVRHLRRFDVFSFRQSVEQYGVVALLTTAVVGLLMLFGSLSGGLVALVIIVPVAGMLMAWPNILRDVGAVELSSEGEDDAPPVRPSRDQGLVLLGIVLLAYGAYSGCGTLLMLTIDLPTEAGLPGMSLPETATWRSLLTTAVNLWAGLELVAMTSRRKAAVAANLAVVGAMTVLNVIDTYKSMELLMESPFGGRRMVQPQVIGMAVVQVLAPLALPVVAVVQALRKPPSAEVNVDEVF